MSPAEAVSRLYDMRVDTTTRDVDGAPHVPCLLSPFRIEVSFLDSLKK